MKKRVVSLVLALALALGLSTTAAAYTDKQNRAAEALYHLGLFLGRSTTTKNFDLDSKLSRAEGVLLLVRMIGKEKEAATYDVADTPFTDVANFWDGKNQFIAYSYQTGMVKGMSATAFGPKLEMNDQMFLTLVLRVLGHEDGEGGTYLWNNARRLAHEVGLVESSEKDTEFTRGDAVLVFWKALNCKLSDGSGTLADRLLAEGVIDAEKFVEAGEIWTYGKILEDNPATPIFPPAGGDDTGDQEEPDDPAPGEDDGPDVGIGGLPII